VFAICFRLFFVTIIFDFLAAFYRSMCDFPVFFNLGFVKLLESGSYGFIANLEYIFVILSLSLQCNVWCYVTYIPDPDIFINWFFLLLKLNNFYWPNFIDSFSVSQVYSPSYLDNFSIYNIMFLPLEFSVGLFYSFSYTKRFSI
jgi:hypothetical protein